MKLDIPDDYVPLLITALEQYYAYTRAVQREDTRYQQAADWFHRLRTPIAEKPVSAPTQPVRRRRLSRQSKRGARL
jgi:hypothetical protein